MSNRQGGTSRGTTYIGTRAVQPPDCFFSDRAPTIYDTSFSLLDLWLDSVSQIAYVLVSLEGNQASAGALATWVPIVGAAGGPITELLDDAGNPIMPNGAGAIQIAGGSNINTVAGVHILTINLDNSIVLPATTADEANGVISIGTEPVLQMYGLDNAFIGGAGNFTLTTALNNVGVGIQSLQDLTTGSNNSALGNLSLGGLESGSNNIGLGYQSGSDYTTNESSNIVIGNVGTIGDQNTIRIGTNGGGAGQQNSAYLAGIYGSAVGGTNAFVFIDNTGKLGTTGGSGVPATSFRTDSGIGFDAVPAAGLIEITGGNSAITNIVTRSPGTGNQVFVEVTPTINVEDNLNMNNTTAGFAAGTIEWGGSPFIHNYGSLNTFVGQMAGNDTLTVVSALANTGVGANALAHLTTGTNNAAFGVDALEANTSGSDNTALGTSALLSLVGNFTNNTSVGAGSLQSLTGGSNNTAVGHTSLENVLTGSNNISLGSGSGVAYTGAESNNITISNAGVLGESNALRIGVSGAGANQVNKAYVGGVYANAGALAALYRVVMSDSNDLLKAVAPTLDGQILIGSGTGAVAYNRLTAGAGVTIANNPGSITISATGAGSGTVTFTTDAGVATEAANNINIFGTANQIETSAPGAADEVQIGLATNVVIPGSLEVTTTLKVDSFGFGLLSSNATGNIASINGTNGQIIVGATGAAPLWVTPVSGDGSITFNPPGFAANTFDIRVTNPAGLIWQTITVNPATAVNHGYNCNGAGPLTIQLPAVSAVGDIIEVTAVNANGWIITQQAGQQIIFTTATTTLGVGGSLASTNIGDCVALECWSASPNSKWIVKSSAGNAITVI